ncbi:hypothetical protein, partial [Ralstonia pseudosolanacearum]|uniref:hypothetical protein n=1 Tax=Ralstonia pseudosolanacearum TaxID=1310165 RepID=UPI003CED584F
MHEDQHVPAADDARGHERHVQHNKFVGLQRDGAQLERDLARRAGFTIDEQQVLPAGTGIAGRHAAGLRRALGALVAAAAGRVFAAALA